MVSGSCALPPRWPPQCSCVVIESSFDPGERLQAPGSLWFFMFHQFFFFIQVYFVVWKMKTVPLADIKKNMERCPCLQSAFQSIMPLFFSTKHLNIYLYFCYTWFYSLMQCSLYLNFSFNFSVKILHMFFQLVLSWLFVTKVKRFMIIFAHFFQWRNHRFNGVFIFEMST